MNDEGVETQPSDDTEVTSTSWLFFGISESVSLLLSSGALSKYNEGDLNRSTVIPQRLTW